MADIPWIVEEAIKKYRPPPGYVLRPPKKSEVSIIYKYGCRVEKIGGATPINTTATFAPPSNVTTAVAAPTTTTTNENASDATNATGTPSSTSEGSKEKGPTFSWVCLADAACRELDLPRLLSGNKTSKATKHLSDFHDVTSDKTQCESDNKRKREEEGERLKRSELYKREPARLRLLLETMRIVLKDLPFNFGESEQSRILDEVFAPADSKVAINAKNVTHSIIELYATTKLEIVNQLQRSKQQAPKSFCLVTDFWSCPVTRAKYLGTRVYFIDDDWNYGSVLLGTRVFDPLFEQRIDGIREPFRLWLELMLSDFRLSPTDFFSATTDAGSDVKYMMMSELQLRWRWCIAHMASCATKTACGIVGDKKKSHNPKMTELIACLSKTVCDVKSVQVMGSLFQFLAQHLADDDAKEDSETTKLLDFKSHRFMGLTQVIKRVLLKWTALQAWYAEHAAHRMSKGKEPKYFFLLEDHKTDLQQLLSIFEPLTSLNFRSQAEGANQVEVVLLLYKARETVLNMNAPVIHYLHTKESPKIIKATDLTPLVRLTRELLCEAFYQNFFKRYCEPGEISTCSYLFEMALFLHPRYKAFESKIGPLVRLCNVQRAVVSPHAVARDVEVAIRDRVKDALKLLSPDDTSKPSANQVLLEFSGDLALYEEEREATQSPQQQHDALIDEELRRWKNDTTTLQESSPGSQRAESVLSYWRRNASRYQLLSKLARMVYAVPTSSAQIERDFGQTGNTVTALRSCISAANLDMTAFLKANVDNVDVTQCSKIRRTDASHHLPIASMAALPVGEFTRELVDQTMLSQFSNDLSMM